MRERPGDVSVLVKGDFLLYVKNSVILTVCGTVGCILLSSMAAYGIARYQFKGKGLLIWKFTALGFGRVPFLKGAEKFIHLWYNVLSGSHRSGRTKPLKRCRIAGGADEQWYQA